MKLKIDSSNKSFYKFEKLNDGNYIIWMFDVKYQFLKKKLWNLVSNTKNPSIHRISISIAIEIMNLIVNAMIAFQVNEEYVIILSMWKDKVNTAYLILITIIIDQLQASVRQATSSMNVWNCLRDLYVFISFQHRFALSRQLYSLHKKSTISMQQHEIIYDMIIKDLVRIEKILNPENLAIMYLNTLSDTYFSLIQSMKSVLIILISQNIKAKIQEKE